jgi:type II secretory pathway component GspD/PulD (secretin)
MPTLPLVPLPRVKGGAFDLRFVNVGQLVDLLYGDAMHTPHVISSEVLQDQRLVSFQYEAKQGDLHAFVKVFLDSLGFRVVTREGVDFVSKKAAAERVDPERETYVYRPRYRPAEYLSKLVQPLFQGRMSAVPVSALSAAVGDVSQGQSPALGQQSAQTPPIVPAMQQGRAGSDSGVGAADELVFTGTAAEVRDVKRVLLELDRAPGEVVVRGWVYEVENTTSKQSAFSIAAHVLGGSLSLANGSTDNDPTALRFQGGWVDAAISALNADSRFHQVSDPHVRVISGQKVHLNVGSQVPTLGAISYQGVSGTPVQSVDYQDAGLIFDVTPTVMVDSIQLTLNEQISSFVATTSGVNNSPTKNTREMSTTVAMQDGEVIVLGGLVQDGDSYVRNSPSWLPKFLDGVSSSKSRTEVLLVLQVQRVMDRKLLSE